MTTASDSTDLRPLRDDDQPLYLTLYTCPRVMARFGPPLDADRATRAFRKVMAHNRSDVPGHRTWAVVDTATGRALGIAALHREGGVAEAGIMLLPAAWDGRRSHAVMDRRVLHAFDVAGVERLIGVCLRGANERMSRRLPQPYGFAEEPPRATGYRAAGPGPRALVGRTSAGDWQERSGPVETGFRSRGEPFR